MRAELRSVTYVRSRIYRHMLTCRPTLEGWRNEGKQISKFVVLGLVPRTSWILNTSPYSKCCPILMDPEDSGDKPQNDGWAGIAI